MTRDFDKRDIKATLAFVCTLHNDLVTKDSQCFFTAVAGLRDVKIPSEMEVAPRYNC